MRTATPFAPTATSVSPRRLYSEPTKINPTERDYANVRQLCIELYTVMTLGVASAFLSAQQAKSALADLLVLMSSLLILLPAKAPVIGAFARVSKKRASLELDLIGSAWHCSTGSGPSF